MKNSLSLLLILLGLFFTACEKEQPIVEEPQEDVWMCYTSFCHDYAYENPTSPPKWLEVEIVEPLVYSDDCKSYVSGVVKYLWVHNQEPLVMVRYGNGECDGVAEKIHCIDGDCYDENAERCEYITNYNLQNTDH
ncbi:hypothetical protein KFE94_06395 [bacterium SCSIO 12643]|nr:hypothetical protein KFE94_06395 [bacterium SCSIO 12643]